MSYIDLVDEVILKPQRQARFAAGSAIDSSPDDAARSMELSKVTGVDPTVINGDVERFDKINKTMMASEIIDSNPHLQDYINSHPMAAKVSNDDWHNLDALSEAMKRLPKGGGVESEPHPIWGAIPDIVQAGKEFFQGIAEAPFQIAGLEEDEQAQRQMIDFMVAKGMDPGAAKVEAALVGQRMERGKGLTSLLFGPGVVALAPLAGSIGLGAFITGQGLFRYGVSRPIQEATGFPMEATESLGLALLGAAGLKSMKTHADHVKVLDQLREVHDAVAAYLAAGVEPPVGVHPIVDQLKVEQAKTDAKALDDAFKEAQGAATRERSPELMEAFIRLQAKGSIGISAEAIRELYGDRQPTPEDGLLGWVSNIEDQLRQAEAVGGDVWVSLADWLAKADPELAKELKDHIRVRASGLTLSEVKELKGGEPIPLPSTIEKEGAPEQAKPEPKSKEEPKAGGIIDKVRDASALGPIFEDRPADALGLKRIKANLLDEYRAAGGSHTFAITDQAGRDVGQLMLTERYEGKDIYVEWVGGKQGPLAFGPRLVRGLLEQIKNEFPNADFISGHRVTGAREKAGTEMKSGMVRVPLKDFREEHLNEITGVLGEGWEDLGHGMGVKLPGELTQRDHDVVRAVNETLDRIIGKEVMRLPAEGIKLGGRLVQGVYRMFRNSEPLIAWSLRSDDPIGTGRHEAIHHLRNYGFFDEREWTILEKAALKEDWLGRHQIDERYQGLSTEAKLEEAIAEQFKDWDWKSADKPEVATVFEKLKKLLLDLRDKLTELYGFEPTVDDIFRKVESGEVGRRGGMSPLDREAFRAQEPKVFETKGGRGQLESAGLTRQEDLDLFEKAKAIGMTEDQYRRYTRLIEKRNAEDLEWQQKQAQKDAQRRLTREWKENEKKVRKEVEDNIEDRPDIAVGNYFRDGVLYGEKMIGKPKLDSAQLSEEQKKALPKGTYGPGGIHPDDVAGLFGFHSGGEMIEAMTTLEKSRGEMPMGDFLEKLTRDEVRRRMEQRYGRLSENILAEAQDHVLSSTQMDLLHEETVAFGMKAGAQMPFTQKDIKGWVETEFGNTSMQSAKANRFLAAAGRSGRRLETQLLKGEAGEAFKLAQQREFAALLAKEAGRFEKEVDKDLRLLERYADRPALKAVAQEYTDQIHSLLRYVEFGIKRTDANLDANLAGNSLFDFIANKNAQGAGILSPNLPSGKSLMDFTVDQYRDFMATIRSLDYNGRKEQLIQLGAREAEFNRVIGRIDTNLGDLEKKGFDPTLPSPMRLSRKILREVDARLVKAEQLADWIDKNDPLGPFNQSVVRPLFEAQHKRGDIIAGLAKDIKAILVDRAWGRSLTDLVDHRYFRNDDGTFVRLTRENMLVMALNWGNKSNRSVLARGHGWSETYIDEFFKSHKHMTKMDWDFVQGVWKVFGKIAPLVEEATKLRSGVPIKMVEPMDVRTAFGKIEGGYYPLIKDPRAVLLGEQKESAIVDKPFFDPLPMARAMNLRTGAAYPLDLSLNSLTSRINETLHAALFQDPVRNARKVIGDTKVRKGIDKAFGPEYVHQLDKWLDDIANNGGESSDAQASWISRNMRENVVFGLMAYKVSTAVIHGGSAAFSSAYEMGGHKNLIKGFMGLGSTIKDLGLAQAMPNAARRFFANEKEMWKQVDWANETFPELRNRMQDVGRDMQAQLASVVNKGFVDDLARIRAVNMAWGMKMVATLDQLTATPVAIAAYNKAIADGKSHGDAVFAGDKAVRHAHGSASLVGRANIGRGEVQKWLTVAYNGYWNHNYNRTRSAVRDLKAEDISFSDKLMIGSAALTALIIAPALIHYAVRGSENETYTGAAAEAVVSQFGGQVPLVNTLTYSMMHNRDPHLSPADEVFSKAVAIKRDVSQLANGRKADNWLKHLLEAPGFFTGIGASNQLATVAQFNKDVFAGKENPKSVLEWARGEITGHAQPPKHRRR